MSLPRFAVSAAALLARTLLRLLWSSHRYRPLGGWSRIDELAAAGGPVILLLWHNQMLLAGPVLLRLARSGLPLTLIVSQSRDGELAARTVRPWKLRINRGSASRGGKAAMRGLYRDIAHHRASPLVLPDGPRGPRYEVKPGVAVLAQMAQAPIVALGFAGERVWKLASWDRLRIGKPGRRVAFALGEPIFVPRKLSEAERASLCSRLARELQTVTRRACDSL